MQTAYEYYQSALKTAEEECKAKVERAREARANKLKIVLTIALLPAGPAIDAVVGAALATGIQGQIASAIGRLPDRFGNARDAVQKMVGNLNANVARDKLKEGLHELENKSIEFDAKSDEVECIESFCEALRNESTRAKGALVVHLDAAKTASEAVGYYNAFRNASPNVYKGMLVEQIQHMLHQLKGVALQGGRPDVNRGVESLSVTETEETVVKVNWNGTDMYAQVYKSAEVGLNPTQAKPTYRFRSWITPDMEASAKPYAREVITADQLRGGGGQIPDPGREAGERVVLAIAGDRERLMVVTVSGGGLFSAARGTLTFVSEPEADSREVEILRGRATTQIGGLERVKLEDIKGVPRSSG